MTKYLSFATERLAREHVAAIDASAEYTGEADLRLPRCDCGGLCRGDHRASKVRRGRLVRAKCTCGAREKPDPDCPFVTWDSVYVLRLGAEYLVAVDPVHAKAGIDTRTARELAPEDEPVRLAKDRMKR